MDGYLDISHMISLDLLVHFIRIVHAVGCYSEFSQGRKRNDPIAVMRIGHFRAVEDPGDQFRDMEDESPHARHILSFAAFDESRTEIEIRPLVLQIESQSLVMLDMFHERLHILHIHLSVRIESDESFDLELIAVSLDEIISGLIGSASSPIDGMGDDDKHVIAVLLLLIKQHLQRIVRGSVIDQDDFPESRMNDLIDHLADGFLFVVTPDIEDEIIFLSLILPMEDLLLVLEICLVDSGLGDESGQLEFILGLFVQCVDIEIEQHDERDIDKQISASRDTEEPAELIEELLIQREDDHQAASDEEYDEMEDIHLLVLVEVDAEQDEHDGREHDYELE